MKDKTTTLFILITNNCNLKCLGCMQSCDRNKNPYYITLQDLENYLKVIRKNNFTVNGIPITNIHLTGGDPLTHPAFIKICETVHNYLPNYDIDVSTNGLLINKITNDQIKYLHETCRVVFQFSLYPTVALLKMYEKIKKRFDTISIPFTFGGSSHFYFSKQDNCNSNPDPCRGYNDSCKQVLNEQQHAILFKGKIYSCWKDINFLQYAPNQNDNGIDLLTIEPNRELIENQPHYYCNLCQRLGGPGGKEYIFWHHHHKDAELIFNTTSDNLFINHYEIYHELQHNCKDAKEILQHHLFQKFLPEEQSVYANTRFLNGKGDIFIPFKNTINPQLKDILKTFDDMKNYNLYFVSINNSPETEKQVYSLFTPYGVDENLKTYFLKANNLVSGYKSFIDNSYLPNKFILDVDNYTIEPFNG